MFGQSMYSYNTGSTMSELNGCPDTLLNSELEIYKHPLVQSLLDALPQPLTRTPWSFTFPISKKMEEEGKIIIAGYASVEVIDSQNELIPIPVLKEAWVKFKANKYFATGSLMHSNIPVIRILDEYKDSKGQVWKSEVDDTGLFIVAEVRNDIEKGLQTIELIKDNKLTGFSIGGEALASSIICEGKCYTRIDKMELHEIAVVDRPANQPSVFTIVKSDRLRKLAELTEALPDLIISPGVAKVAGSVAELGEGHDFDLIITASEGSFVDRAIQTRIFNELRRKGKEDLWKSLHVIHEPEGLGPFTDHYDLFDLVLLRSTPHKRDMTYTGGEKTKNSLKDKLVEEFKLNPGQAGLLINWLGDAAKKLVAVGTKKEKFECPILVSVEKLDEAIDKANSSRIMRKSISHLDEAISKLSLNRETITS